MFHVAAFLLSAVQLPLLTKVRDNDNAVPLIAPTYLIVPISQLIARLPKICYNIVARSRSCSDIIDSLEPNYKPYLSKFTRQTYPSWTCMDFRPFQSLSGLFPKQPAPSKTHSSQCDRLTQAEQRQLEQRMQKRQVKEFMGVCYFVPSPFNRF